MSYLMIRPKGQFEVKIPMWADLGILASAHGWVTGESEDELYLKGEEKSQDEEALSSDGLWFSVYDAVRAAAALRRALREIQSENPDQSAEAQGNGAIKTWMRTPEGKEFIRQTIRFLEDGGFWVTN
jgi:hypothetical protein